MAPSFIESGYTTKAEYDKALASGTAGVAAGGEPITLGYWKIRGLAAAARMMFYYKATPFKNVAYGEDAADEWFSKDKPTLQKQNTMMNLPYLIDGSTVITQSNSCLFYLGQKLGIDLPEHMIANHQVLDQTMDLRNELMKICYGPAGKDFKPALEGHMKSARTHLAKLEGFCSGPFMCGAVLQSSDFHVFEMFDQHMTMCTEMGVPFDAKKECPKLFQLHARIKGAPELAAYFKADCYAKYAVNNPAYANWTGKAYGNGPFGPTLREDVKPTPPEPKKAKGGAAQQAKQTPEEKEAAKVAAQEKKLREKIIKEGGKKGVEIEGASDMGGLDFFCTTMELPEGNLEFLEMSMDAMNAEPDPEAEDRKGCSGHVGKMIFSAGVEQLAIVAYVPDAEHNKSADKIDCQVWLDTVVATVDGTVVKSATAANSPKGGKVATAVVKKGEGKFPIKDKDTAMAAAFNYLRSKGAFPEDTGDDDSDEMIFGDDDDLANY